MAFDKRLRMAHIEIHRALHDVPLAGKVMFSAGGSKAITRSANGLRQVIYGNYLFMQQNPYKSSRHALRAREGAKITWGITSDNSPWIYIDDDIASAFTQAEFEKNDPIKEK